MTTLLNGARHEPLLVLHLCAGKWLIGVERASSGGERLGQGSWVTLDGVAEYHGETAMQPSRQTRGAVEVQHPRAVKPLEGLCSLKSFTFSSSGYVAVDDLDKREAQDIKRHYAACEDLLRNVRASMAGIAPPLVVVPG
jgi:hypothetical protein